MCDDKTKHDLFFWLEVKFNIMSNLKYCNYSDVLPNVWDVTSFWQTSQFIIGRFGVLATCPTLAHSATPSYSGGGRSTGTPSPVLLVVPSTRLDQLGCQLT